MANDYIYTDASWDTEAEKIFECGVDHGLLFVKNDQGEYDNGVIWNGLVSVSESPDGGEPNPQYADNIKYLNLMSVENFNFTIEAFTYPKEFGACNGCVESTDGFTITGQTRKEFGFVYRTKVGNASNPKAGYKYHFVYNCLAAPSDKSYETEDDNPEAMTFSFEVSTTPAHYSFTVGSKEYSGSTAHVEVDSTKVNETKMQSILALIMGSHGTSGSADVPSKLPSVNELAGILNAQ